MPVGTKLRYDMLTSLIVTNTERDMNSMKITTDVEIRGNLVDAFLGSIDTVSII